MREKFKSTIIKLLNNIVELRNKSRFLFTITHKNYIRKRFRAQHGYKVSFKNPSTYSEKIQWIKLHGPKYSMYVDKNEVRNFVKERVGKEYLIPKIGVYQSADEINLDLLPNKFVIKATHGCGWNLIVHDKSKLDWSKTKERIKRWINSNYFFISGEKNYRNIKGRVIVENLIEDPTGNMKEYKFFCFHGEPKYVVAVTVPDPRTRIKGFYDRNWNWINMNINGLPNINNKVDKPYHYNEMLEISRKLSNDFSFVRVDLYYSQGKIYVGELTFTPNNGFGRFSDLKYDKKFGEHLNLSGVQGK